DDIGGVVAFLASDDARSILWIPSESMAARSSEAFHAGNHRIAGNILPLHVSPTWHFLHGICHHRHAPARSVGWSLAAIRRLVCTSRYGGCPDSQHGGNAPTPTDVLGVINWSGVASVRS